VKHQSTTTDLRPMPVAAAPGTSGAIDTETLALLEAWAREDATSDPEKLRTARKELDEFKQAMNENRAATGERILYP